MMRRLLNYVIVTNGRGISRAFKKVRRVYKRIPLLWRLEQKRFFRPKAETRTEWAFSTTTLAPRRIQSVQNRYARGSFPVLSANCHDSELCNGSVAVPSPHTPNNRRPYRR